MGRVAAAREQVAAANPTGLRMSYEQFLDLLYFYYAENMREAELGTREG